MVFLLIQIIFGMIAVCEKKKRKENENNSMRR
jgi:hypothetical protein